MKRMTIENADTVLAVVNYPYQAVQKALTMHQETGERLEVYQVEVPSSMTSIQELKTVDGRVLKAVYSNGQASYY